MPKGFSLHIGLNQVDQQHYGGLSDLKSAIFDAQTMQAFAERFGYERSEPLHNEQATASAVIDKLAAWAKELLPGDILLLSYSGHGGQIDDPQYYTPDDKGADETWCLYDRQLLDDELFEAFLQFKEGVRILVVSDSCHSGTMTKAIDVDVIEEAISATLASLEKQGVLRNKSMKGIDPYAKNYATVYKPVLERLKQTAGKKNRRVAAAVKLFAACQDNQVAYDGDKNGRFTAMLKALMDRDLVNEHTNSEKLLHLLKNQFQYPTPNLLDYGAIIDSFDRYFPFIVDLPAANETIGYRTPPSEESTPIAWRNLTANDGPPTPTPDPLSVAVEFFEGDNHLQALLPLLPEGVKSIRVQRKNTFVVDFQQGKYASVWDAIHLLLEQADAAGIDLEAEPAQTAPTPVADKETGTKAGGSSFDYLPKWPPASNGSPASFAWHLGDDYSQLARARDHVMARLEDKTLTKRVRIAHFDTGYFPSHPAIWDNPHILRDLAKSFVPGEMNNKALDVYYGDGEVQGHGLGTLALLAGWKLKPEDADGQFSGYFGAVPCAEVIPMRLADGVVIMDSESFVDAVDYAIETGCEVITMSRGGKPSLKMARAVNKAYEAGIVLVTAGGNSIVGGPGFAKLGPRTVIWPARFQRVIAACGVCQNHFPYDFEAQEKFSQTRGSDLIERMQGNWGPENAMKYALATYTPNVPWALYRKAKYFSLDGGGTSSATPQIAAAAALYIMEHRAELEAKGYYNKGQQWKKAEAVRRALFSKAHIDPGHPELKKYYGNGILKAMDALQVPVMDITDDMKAPKAESSWLGLSEAVGLFLNRRRDIKPAGPAMKRATSLEINHVLMSDPSLAALYDRLPFEDEHWPETLVDEVVAAVKGSGYCSETLRKEL